MTEKVIKKRSVIAAASRLIEQFTPPEWPVWSWVAQAVYTSLVIGIMFALQHWVIHPAAVWVFHPELR